MIRIAATTLMLMTLVSPAFADDYVPPPVDDGASLVEEEEEEAVVVSEESRSRVLRNDNRDFVISVEAAQYRNEHAYRFLGHDDLGEEFVQRQKTRPVIITAGFGVAVISLASMFLAVTAFAVSFGDVPPIVPVMGYGGLGMLAVGGGLVGYGFTRSNHPVDPGQRLELLRQFDGRR